MILNSAVLVINKIDLLPYLPCNLDALRSNALKINPGLRIFELSCTTGEGVAAWCDWLRKKD
jgi:hydrogenase nickel incorporation protein HypB